MLISIVLLGKYIESVAKGHTSDAVSALMDLQVHSATIVKLNETTNEVCGTPHLSKKDTHATKDPFRVFK